MNEIQDSIQTSLLQKESVGISHNAQNNPVSLGEYLAHLRIRKNLSIEAVSSQIKFSSTMIKALELSDWSVLPKGFVLRAMVRNYARMLGIDENQALNLLRNEVGEQQTSEIKYDYTRYKNRPLSEEDGVKNSLMGTLTWIFFIIAILALFAWYAHSKAWFSWSDFSPSKIRSLFN